MSLIIKEMTLTENDFEISFKTNKCHLCGSLIISRRFRSYEHNAICSDCIVKRDKKYKKRKRTERLDSFKRY